MVDQQNGISTITRQQDTEITNFGVWIVNAYLVFFLLFVAFWGIGCSACLVLPSKAPDPFHQLINSSLS